MPILIRERCFRCGYIYQEFVTKEFVFEKFKKIQSNPKRNLFPKCPSCRKLVHLVSFEAVPSYKKGRKTWK